MSDMVFLHPGRLRRLVAITGLPVPVKPELVSVSAVSAKQCMSCLYSHDLPSMFVQALERIWIH